MSATKDPICGNPAALAGYLYGEGDPPELAAAAAHLADCDQCAATVASLAETREALTAWAPPDAALGCRVAPDQAMAPLPGSGLARGGWSAVPVWAQAAAAVFLFACGAIAAAVMNLDVRYDASGVSVRTGWGARAMVPAATAAPAVNGAALDERIRAAESPARVDEGPRSSGAKPAGVVASSGAPVAQASVEGLLRRVEQLLAESEIRQQRELALRVSQVLRDVDSQHRADVERIERTVSPVAGLTAEEIQEQRQMLNYLMRVSRTK